MTAEMQQRIVEGMWSDARLLRHTERGFESFAVGPVHLLGRQTLRDVNPCHLYSNGWWASADSAWNSACLAAHEEDSRKYVELMLKEPVPCH